MKTITSAEPPGSQLDFWIEQPRQPLTRRAKPDSLKHTTKKDMRRGSGSNWNERVDGYTAGAWKSLAVKSLRLGWVVGLRVAEEHLGKSYMKAALICGLFEDVFPAESELKDAFAEAGRLDYEALCKRQTHHGRAGLTDRFCELEAEAVSAAHNQQADIYAAGKARGLWLPPRSLNCFYTWERMLPQDAGQTRELDYTPWTGMPEAMLDGHTLEGKQAKRNITILSGHYENHSHLAKLIAKDGWAGVRAKVHGTKAEDSAPPKKRVYI